MQRTIVQDIGWYGVIAILMAYGGASLGWLSVHALWYQILNLTGAAAIAFEAGKNRDRQPMVLNIIWAIVALVALIRLWMR